MSASVWIRAGVYRSACKCITMLKNSWAHCHSRQTGLGPGQCWAERNRTSRGRAKVGSGYALIMRYMIQPRWPCIDPWNFVARRGKVLCMCVLCGINWSWSQRLCLCTSERFFFCVVSARINLTSDIVGCKLMSFILIPKFNMSQYFDCNNTELDVDTWW